MRVSLGDTLHLYLLDYEKITWEEYAEVVAPENRPSEYATMVLWLRNRGKVTKRLDTEDELRAAPD